MVSAEMAMPCADTDSEYDSLELMCLCSSDVFAMLTMTLLRATAGVSSNAW